MPPSAFARHFFVDPRQDRIGDLVAPTHDDVTSECVAKAFGVPLIRHPEAERLLRAHYDPDKLNEARAMFDGIKSASGGVFRIT